MKKGRGRPKKERTPTAFWTKTAPPLEALGHTAQDYDDWLIGEATREWSERAPKERPERIESFLREWLKPETRKKRIELVCGLPEYRSEERKTLATLIYEKEWQERRLLNQFGDRVRDLPKMNRKMFHNPRRKAIREIKATLDPQMVESAERDAGLMLDAAMNLDPIAPGEERAKERTHQARILNTFLDFVVREKRLPEKSELKSETIDRMPEAVQADRILNFPQFPKILNRLGLNGL